MNAGLGQALRARITAAIAPTVPALRVVGLAYTGLGGMLALGLLATVAMIPVAPVVVQQAAEPARQAATGLIHPVGDAMANFIGYPAPLASPTATPEAAPLDLRLQEPEPAQHSLEVPVEPEPMVTPEREFERASQPLAARAWSSEAPDATDVPQTDEDIVPEEQPAAEAVAESSPEPVVVVQPAEPSQQVASTEFRALPPTPVPSLTPAQLKAEQDAANQAAIDAARTEQARAKAEADAANEAAIQARLAADRAQAADQARAEAEAAATRVATLPTSTPTPTAATTPAVVASGTPVAQTKAPLTANDANQAAIDAIKADKVRAKAQADAANAAAIAAARAAKVSPTPSATPAATQAPMPTATPLPPPPPSLTPEPTMTDEPLASDDVVDPEAGPSHDEDEYTAAGFDAQDLEATSESGAIESAAPEAVDDLGAAAQD